MGDDVGWVKYNRAGEEIFAYVTGDGAPAQSYWYDNLSLCPVSEVPVHLIRNRLNLFDDFAVDYQAKRDEMFRQLVENQIANFDRG